MAKKERYRVAVIGHTGRGNYGHGLDTVWRDVANTNVVAVADPDQEGLRKACQRVGGDPVGYADYRELLEKEKPEFVSIAPRWIDQHHDMVLAAASAGVRGIYLEKPMCRTLSEADAMVEACEKSGTKVAIAFQTRYSPILDVVNQMIDEGAIGEPLEFRGRGKEDRRGGGEDLWVLGSHIMNLIHNLGGAPEWCSARVYQDRKLVTKEHIYEGNEGLGPLAGNRLSAMYGLESGATAYFGSWRDHGHRPSRFGLQIFGSEGVIEVHEVGYVPKVFWLGDPAWSPGRSNKEWVAVSSQGPGKPEVIEGQTHHLGNVAACENLIQSVEGDVQPEASLFEGRTTVEMIAAVYESHRQGGRCVDIPLATREHPLTLLQ